MGNNEVYIVELIDKQEDVVGLGMIETGNKHSWIPASASGYQYCSKFHNKERAEKAAVKIRAKYVSDKTRSFKDFLMKDIQARVVSEFGTPAPKGTKQFTTGPQKDKVRR